MSYLRIRAAESETDKLSRRWQNARPHHIYSSTLYTLLPEEIISVWLLKVLEADKLFNLITFCECIRISIGDRNGFIIVLDVATVSPDETKIYERYFAKYIIEHYLKQTAPGDDFVKFGSVRAGDRPSADEMKLLVLAKQYHTSRLALNEASKTYGKTCIEWLQESQQKGQDVYIPTYVSERLLEEMRDNAGLDGGRFIFYGEEAKAYHKLSCLREEFLHVMKELARNSDVDSVYFSVGQKNNHFNVRNKKSAWLSAMDSAQNLSDDPCPLLLFRQLSRLPIAHNITAVVYKLNMITALGINFDQHVVNVMGQISLYSGLLDAFKQLNHEYYNSQTDV